MPYTYSFGALALATGVYIAITASFAGGAAALSHPVWLMAMTAFLILFAMVELLRKPDAAGGRRNQRRARSLGFAASAALLAALNVAVLVAIAPWRGLDALAHPGAQSIFQSWLIGAAAYLGVAAIIGSQVRRRAEA